MTKKQELNIHAVEMMRSIRDDLSQKLMRMTHEEQRQYIGEQLEREATEQRSESRSVHMA